LFQLVSTTPGNEASGVARDAAIEIVFSAAVDPESVSAGAIEVSGPAGVVAGSFEVNDATVTFTSDDPLALLANYTIQVASEVKSLAGRPLNATEEVTFTTRDGILSAPKRLWASSAGFQVEATRSGYVAVRWVDDLVPPSIVVSLFDPGTGAWGQAQRIETDTQNNLSSGCLALNERGEAFAVVGYTSFVWNRAVAGTWDVAIPAATIKASSCALADDGAAMTTWDAPVGGGTSVFAARLSVADEWSATHTLQSNATSQGVSRYKEGFLAFYARAAGGVYSNEFDPTLGWLPAKAVTSPDMSPSYRSLDVLAEVALLTWTGDGRVHASLYDGRSWSTDELAPVSYGTYASVGANGHLAAWNYQGNAYAARYDLNLGWQDPIKLGATLSEDFGPAVTVDDSGNAFAAWPHGSSIYWRRSASGMTEWGEAAEIKDQDAFLVVTRVDASGNVTLVWQNPLGVWASRFE
jgi:hypothetical protein